MSDEFESLKRPTRKVEAEQQTLFDLPNFYKDEWVGMPEFDNYEKAVKQLIVHFESTEDVIKFERVIGQKITESTKSIWYPKKEITKTSDMVYKSES